jgi:hypothetical protein
MAPDCSGRGVARRKDFADVEVHDRLRAVVNAMEQNVEFALLKISRSITAGLVFSFPDESASTAATTHAD